MDSPKELYLATEWVQKVSEIYPKKLGTTNIFLFGVKSKLCQSFRAQLRNNKLQIRQQIRLAKEIKFQRKQLPGKENQSGTEAGAKPQHGVQWGTIEIDVEHAGDN
ncbi:hypothetical protein HUJ05_006895 [Dendroctonus ponderosae]|nr:hypothetical protein HUJ05_006895 [Dendroctonus ponderosae]